MISDKNLLLDGFVTQWGGTDSGVDPSLLDRDKNSFAVNCKGRGGILTHRPVYQEVVLGFAGDVLEQRFTNGRFQVAGVYQPDNGPAVILCSVGGRQFRLNVATDNSVQEITITGSTLSAALFTVPAVGATDNATVGSTANLAVGATVSFGGFNFIVSAIVDGTTVTLENVDGTPGTVIAVNTPLFYYDLNPATKQAAWCVQAENYWVLQNNQNLPFIYDGASARRAASNVPVNQGREIPVGNVMEYAMGRIAVALPDNRTFAIGDLVGSSAGTAANQYRDAVLKFTQNTFLNSGRNFTVPQTAGGITAMRSIPTLDAALGQGPLMVCTPSIIFTVALPTDETTWQNLTNPIQTVALITNGALSQNGTILVNGDVWYRSSDGWRSFVLARRDFNTWANTPVSSEMDRVLAFDDPDLLGFSTSAYFDGRMLMSVSPARSEFGTYHRGIIALDLNRVSGLREKLPPAYDGLWTGLNATQIVAGRFAGVDRCFVFSVDYAGSLRLFELVDRGEYDILPTGRKTRVQWSVETGMMLAGTGQRGAGVFDQKRLESAELWVDEVWGTVEIKSWYRPIGTVCWVPWRNNITLCATTNLCTDLPTGECQDTTVFKPQYRSRVGFGKPGDVCEFGTNRPAHTSEGFQLRLEILGHCRIRGLRVLGRLLDEPVFETACP